MAKNRITTDAVDYIGEKTEYWETAARYAERILASENPTEILADYLTKLAFNDIDASTDPIDALVEVSSDWGIETTEEDEDYGDLC